MIQCCDQLTPVKSSFPLTSTTEPYCGLKFVASRSRVSLKFADQKLVFACIAGSRKQSWFFREPHNSNPGSKVNQIKTVSSIQFFFLTAFVFCVGFVIIKLKKEGQTLYRKPCELNSKFNAILA